MILGADVSGLYTGSARLKSEAIGEKAHRESGMTVVSGGTSIKLLLGAMVGLVGLAIFVFVVTLFYLRGRDDKRGSTRSKRARGDR